VRARSRTVFRVHSLEGGDELAEVLSESLVVGHASDRCLAHGSVVVVRRTARPTL
jgi:hypothetical protein